MIVQTKPVPYCPTCGAQMQLRRPRPDQEWSPFWGCARFPACKGTRQIGSDGKPEGDEDTETWYQDDETDS